MVKKKKKREPNGAAQTMLVVGLLGSTASLFISPYLSKKASCAVQLFHSHSCLTPRNLPPPQFSSLPKSFALLFQGTSRIDPEIQKVCFFAAVVLFQSKSDTRCVCVCFVKQEVKSDNNHAGSNSDIEKKNLDGMEDIFAVAQAEGKPFAGLSLLSGYLSNSSKSLHQQLKMLLQPRWSRLLRIRGRCR